MRVGDFVEITNVGKIYSTYDDMAQWLDATKWVASDIGTDNHLEGCHGIIKAMKEHPNRESGRVCLLVDIGNREIIIGTEGVRVVTENISPLEDAIYRAVIELGGRH